MLNTKLLSQYSPLPKNYDFSEVMVYEPVAQDIWVKPLIGDDLWYELEDQMENNDLTDKNNALLTEGHLLRYMSYATVLEALPFVWANISTAGITLGKSENSDSVSLKDMSYIEQHIRRQVEALKDLVKKYICEHNDYFPDADFCACGCDCCEEHGKLNKPNPLHEVYSTLRKKTDIK